MKNEFENIESSYSKKEVAELIKRLENTLEMGIVAIDPKTKKATVEYLKVLKKTFKNG